MEAGAIGDGMEVVVFPWLAFGHMLPFLELSKRLAARGHAVTFVSTPRNLARLPPVPPYLSARLRFVSLPLPRVDGLPEGTESTADVPPGKDELLKKAMDGLAAPFTAFLADAVAGGRRPDWIINDFCHHWLPSIAAEHKVPCALFQIVLAGMVAYFGSRLANSKHPRTALEDFAVPPEWFSAVSSTIVYGRHEAGWLAGCFRPNASGVSDMERFWQINEQCHIAIYRSCDEIEPGMFALLADLFQKPSIPIGTLPPPHELGDDEIKVPCALFQIVLAGMVAYFGSRLANSKHPRTALEDFAVPPDWFSAVSSTIVYGRHEAGWLAGCFRPNASGVSDMERFWQINEQCHIAIYRSCDEIEPGMFALLADLFQKPSIPIGTLPPPHELGDDEIIRSDVLQWLDGQPPKSVIYVALGSEAPLSVENLHELALGLELAGVRFVWALRRLNNTKADVGGHSVLPDGFEERTRHCGLVITGWVPQVKVLAHGSVGAFLTHCGWGSTLESFMFGLPLVMLPFIVDQPLVARTMVEKGIGVEVARDEGDGSFDRDGVAAAVRRVMVEEEGKVLASKAQKLQEVLADQGRQEQYIDDLVDDLRRYKDAAYNCSERAVGHPALLSL